MHKVSDRSTARESDDDEDLAHWLGESCWWTIHPASKQRSEGEKVRFNDDVILVSVFSERYLVSASSDRQTRIHSNRLFAACLHVHQWTWSSQRLVSSTSLESRADLQRSGTSEKSRICSRRWRHTIDAWKYGSLHNDSTTRFSSYRWFGKVNITIGIVDLRSDRCAIEKYRSISRGETRSSLP